MTEVDALLEKAGLALEETENGLVLTDGKMSVHADYTKMLSRLAPGKLQRELLVRAAKVKHPGASAAVNPEASAVVERTRPIAVDATAGLGEDSLLLAAAGFEVYLFERNPVIARLLQDALRRAAEHPQLASIVARMHAENAESVEALAELDMVPDVVLLDPMFPAKQKNSLVKKKLQLLQRLESPCDDEEALLSAALARHPQKVVVKRPLKGPHLAGRKPSYSLAGKAVRYDCIVLGG